MYIDILPRPLLASTQVEEGDGSSRLGYTSSAALSAEEGDILRASANPTTLVDLTLPTRGAAGSLSWSCEVVVDSTAARVVNVRVFILSTVVVPLYHWLNSASCPESLGTWDLPAW